MAVAEHFYAPGCHVCQKSDVVAVCHHCGLPFCAEHLPTAPRAWYRIDREYHGLDVGGGPPAAGPAVHCRRHRHDRFNWPRFYLSALLIFLGLLWPAVYALRQGVRPPPALLALALLAAGFFVLTFLVDFLSDRASEPPLPLFGHGPALQLRELISGQVRLQPNGVYRAETLRTTGRLDFSLAPDGSEARRRAALRRRYHLRSPARLATSAGFLMLTGRARWQLQGAGYAALEQRPHILALAGPTDEHPFFPLDGNPQPLTLAPHYHFSLAGDLPLRLLPTLVSSQTEQDREWELGLELTVQLLATPPHLLAGAEVVVKELTLCAPPQLGRVRNRRPAALEPAASEQETADDTAQCVGGRVAALSWQNVELLPEPEGPPVWARTPGYHRTFYALFTESARLRYATLSGQLVLSVRRALLSGLNGALFFSPLGQRRDDLSFQGETEIRVSFELSMDSLPVHARVAREEKREYAERANYERVLQLSRTLNRRGYYVKHLVEHTSGVINRDDDRPVDRSWTVAGRTYRGLFPVNFEMIVSCPEPGGRRGDGAVTLVELRAEALAGRLSSIQALESSVQQLLLICEQVFGAGQPPGPATEYLEAEPASGLQPQPPAPGAAMTPGYDRQRQRDDRAPGV